MRDHRIRRASVRRSRCCSTGCERLEYRGYDSAGIALLEDDGLDYVRAVGNLQNLKDAAGPNGSTSRPASATRAGRRTAASPRQNAHPLTGCDDEQARDRPQRDRRELPRAAQAADRSDGHTFTSETDAEVVVAPARARLRRRPRRRRSARVYAQLEGHFTFVAIHHDHPDLLVGVRCQTPLVVGLGEGENFLASNVAAFLRETRRVQFPDDGEIVAITPARRALLRPRRRRVDDARGRGARLGRRGRREGRLRDVHAQGDLRAARGRARDDRRPRRGTASSCSRASA